jgi:hypothetical protein
MKLLSWIIICMMSSTSLSVYAGEKGISLVTEQGEPLVSADQLLSYRWDTHTITLQPSIKKALWEKHQGKLVSGVPFGLAIDGKVIYRGTLTTEVSSSSFATPVILISPVGEEFREGDDELRLELGYPDKQFKGEDPRSDAKILAALKANNKLTPTLDQHRLWIEKSMRIISTIKTGMTREELMKVFREEGGLSSRTTQRFVYRDCPYIKVNVTFKAVGEPDKDRIHSQRDTIATLSKPFLEWSIMD